MVVCHGAVVLKDLGVCCSSECWFIPWSLLLMLYVSFCSSYRILMKKLPKWK